MSEVTRILEAVERGDPTAAEELLPLVYDELRRLAAVKMGNGFWILATPPLADFCQREKVSPRQPTLGHAPVARAIGGSKFAEGR